MREKASDPTMRDLIREAVQDAMSDIFRDHVPAQERIVVKPAMAAAMISQGVSTIYVLMSEGELESVRLGNSRLIPVRALQALIERRMRQERAQSLTSGASPG